MKNGKMKKGWAVQFAHDWNKYKSAVKVGEIFGITAEAASSKASYLRKRYGLDLVRIKIQNEIGDADIEAIRQAASRGLKEGGA